MNKNMTLNIFEVIFLLKDFNFVNVLTASPPLKYMEYYLEYVLFYHIFIISLYPLKGLQKNYFLPFTSYFT